MIRKILSAAGVGDVIEQSRNPFGVMDVPFPEDDDVAAFAAAAAPLGSDTDANSDRWCADGKGQDRSIEGAWFTRWNGGADPTIVGDSPDSWKSGDGEVKEIGDRVYLLFNWSHSARRGLIDARRQGEHGLVGKYINLSAPAITRPWVGTIVSNSRIDGQWTNGRLDFRR